MNRKEETNLIDDFIRVHSIHKGKDAFVSPSVHASKNIPVSDIVLRDEPKQKQTWFKKK